MIVKLNLLKIEQKHIDFLQKMDGFIWITTIQPNTVLHYDKKNYPNGKPWYIKSEIRNVGELFLISHGLDIDNLKRETKLRLHQGKEIGDVIHEILRNGCDAYILKVKARLKKVKSL